MKRSDLREYREVDFLSDDGPIRRVGLSTDTGWTVDDVVALPGFADVAHLPVYEIQQHLAIPARYPVIREACRRVGKPVTHFVPANLANMVNQWAMLEEQVGSILEYIDSLDDDNIARLARAATEVTEKLYIVRGKCATVLMDRLCNRMVANNAIPHPAALRARAIVEVAQAFGLTDRTVRDDMRCFDIWQAHQAKYAPVQAATKLDVQLAANSPDPVEALERIEQGKLANPHWSLADSARTAAGTEVAVERTQVMQITCRLPLDDYARIEDQARLQNTPINAILTRVVRSLPEAPGPDDTLIVVPKTTRDAALALLHEFNEAQREAGKPELSLAEYMTLKISQIARIA